MMARDRGSRPEAKPLRLFVAVEVPDAAKRVVAEAIEPWRKEFPRARWAPQENWHVTLKFLGSTWPRLMEWVVETVHDVAGRAAPFESRLTDLGSFPSSRRARVVWAGLDDGAGAMAGLAGALDEALAREFEAEHRAFRPHLTVARSDPPLQLPGSFADSVLEAEPFTIDRLVLFRSHLRRPAPRYEPLQTFSLGPG